MSATPKWHLVSVRDYLARELASPVKHEYLGGLIYDRAATRNAHNLIATNINGIVGVRLRGKRCRAYNSNTKIRLRLPTHVRFYYPDVSVICRSNPPNDSFQDEPVVLFEVLSNATRRIDDGEKRDAYLTIPSLCAYVLIEQETPAVMVYRRTENGFLREIYEGLDAVIPLREIETELPLAEVYETVEFTPEATDDGNE
jgi:Uma2 family endonuclease